jgi:hypothetical protein
VLPDRSATFSPWEKRTPNQVKTAPVFYLARLQPHALSWGKLGRDRFVIFQECPAYSPGLNNFHPD